LLKQGEDLDKLKGNCLHRLDISWKATADKLRDGIKPDVIREQLEIYHPLSTSVMIDAKMVKNY